MLARVTEVSRATERLNGIIMGISLDNKITDAEVRHLGQWLDRNRHLQHMQPFRQIAQAVSKILEDGIITEDEKEDLLELCWGFDNDSMVCECATTAIRRLHGVLQGVIADAQITMNETTGLKNWLKVHDAVKDFWPFCDLWQIVRRVLSDGKLDAAEHAELKDFFENFAERVAADPIIHDEIYSEAYMRNESPVLLPFTALCDSSNRVLFNNRKFCFTGPARTGKRETLHAITASLSGIPVRSVENYLDYLVIGAQSSPCWIYSTYGRKVEKAISLQKSGGQTAILHEDFFIAEAQANGAHIL